MKYTELYKLLESNGWKVDRVNKHKIYIHPDFDKPIVIGKHGNEEVPKGTLHTTMKRAGLK